MADEPFGSNTSSSSAASKQHPHHPQRQSHHQTHHHHQNHHLLLHGGQQQMLEQQQLQIPPIPQVGPQQHSSDQFRLPLSLPLHPQSQQQNHTGGAGKPRADVIAAGSHGRDDAWTEVATLALIDAWGERYLQLNRGNLKQKHWREVADEVNRRSALDESSSGKACKSDVQCKNRLDTLKKKYKIEKSRLAAEGSPSKWPFFVKLDELVGPSKKGKKQRVPSWNATTTNSGLNHAGNAANNGMTNTAYNGGMGRSREEHPLRQHHHQPGKAQPQQQQQQQQATTSSSSQEYSAAGMTDSCENGVAAGEAGKSSASNRKRRRAAAEGGSFRDLARAIVKFGEVYERIESAKQQQMMDLERQRMEFTKDMELQRMQLFMQMQVELAKLKHGGGKHGNTAEHYL